MSTASHEMTAFLSIVPVDPYESDLKSADSVMANHAVGGAVVPQRAKSRSVGAKNSNNYGLW